MRWRGPTYRMVGGERVGEAWCHVWRRHRGSAEYFVEDLVAFADGAVGCGELTDLAGLERMLAAGRIAVTDPAAPPYEVPRASEPRAVAGR
ncbi:hypothetical protein ABZ848_43315 [Streptomyces sp. NPDC047081]|uniref:DUF7638 domain-containing protein n=1 Tax=Streptomyces sp. NPDC047081 TaxID=3154706 RepID=UPI0033EDBDC2